jgi:hypothetical protein
MDNSNNAKTRTPAAVRPPATTLKRFLKGLLFVLIFLLINAAIGSLFMNRQVSQSRTGTIDRQFHQHEKNIRMLALGDSHVATGFDPRVFKNKNAFNFSLYGENYIYNYYKLKYILERNLQVKIIILPIDLHSFSSWRADRFLHDFYWVKYVNYWEVGRYKGELVKFVSKYINGRFFPYKGEFEAMFGLPPQKSRERKAQLPDIFQGFVIKTETFHHKRVKKARQRVRLHFGKHRYFDEELAHYFRKILALCAEKDIRLILVKFPVSKIYFRLVSRKVPVKTFYEKVQSMIAPYGNIRVFDYQDYFFEDDVTVFDDPDHLNHVGARLFSEDLRRRLAETEQKKNTAESAEDAEF